MIYAFKPALFSEKFNPYIHFPDFLTSGECSKIKKLMKNPVRAYVEGDGSGKINESIRGTSVSPIEPIADNFWIFEKLSQAVIPANHATWGFDMAGFCEGIQISRYDVGDHYGYHQDIGGTYLSQRKLSIVIQLSDPKEYDGGLLEIFMHGNAPVEQGTLILFPSYMVHQVTPITKGTRYSLVAWLSGNPFK